MGASEKFYLTIVNDSKTKTLIYKDINFDWGRVESSSYPVAQVPPKTTVQVLVAQGRDNTSSGTEGSISYSIYGQNDRWVKASWNVPWAAGAENTCVPSTSDDNQQDNPDGNIVWQPQTATADGGTTLSVVMKFGYEIEE
ncbi:aegerolysin family protein [Pseudomonas sp. GM50]|uniref:aegerolysin family protein n=1 Tax=Pseudomonas sp. GM50 TaxID=1144332 RepID=UPI0012F701A7|nr:aegerolysin family protein [Pseudomonas sp. GM50]